MESFGICYPNHGWNVRQKSKILNFERNQFLVQQARNCVSQLRTRDTSIGIWWIWTFYGAIQPSSYYSNLSKVFSFQSYSNIFCAKIQIKTIICQIFLARKFKSNSIHQCYSNIKPSRQLQHFFEINHQNNNNYSIFRNASKQTRVQKSVAKTCVSSS